jgi:hypothetical protein
MKSRSLVLIVCLLAGILILSLASMTSANQIDNYQVWVGSGNWQTIDNLTFTLDHRCAVSINSDGDIGENAGALNTQLRLVLDGVTVAGENLNIAQASWMGGFYVSPTQTWTNITSLPCWRSLQNALSVSTDTILTRVFMPAMTLRQLIASVTVNSSPSGSYDVTLCKNGVATGLTVNIPFGVTGALTATADVVLVAGDYVSYYFTKTGTPASGTVTVILLLSWTPSLSAPIYSGFAMSHATVLDAGAHTVQVQAWVAAGDNILSLNRGLNVLTGPSGDVGQGTWLRDFLIWLGEDGRYWLGVIVILVTIIVICWVFFRDD